MTTSTKLAVAGADPRTDDQAVLDAIVENRIASEIARDEAVEIMANVPRFVDYDDPEAARPSTVTHPIVLWRWTGAGEPVLPMNRLAQDRIEETIEIPDDYLALPDPEPSVAHIGDVIAALVDTGLIAPATIGRYADPRVEAASRLSARLEIYDGFADAADGAALAGRVAPSGGVWTVVDTTGGSLTLATTGRAVVSPTTGAGIRLALQPMVTPQPLAHRAHVAMRHGNTATGLVVLAYNAATGNYLWAGVRAASSSLAVGKCVSGVHTTLGTPVSLGGTNPAWGMVAEINAQLHLTVGTSQRNVRVTAAGVTVVANTYGDADVDAIIAGATHVGAGLDRGDALEFCSAYRGSAAT